MGRQPKSCQISSEFRLRFPIFRVIHCRFWILRRVVVPHPKSLFEGMLQHVLTGVASETLGPPHPRITGVVDTRQWAPADPYFVCKDSSWQYCLFPVACGHRSVDFVCCTYDIIHSTAGVHILPGPVLLLGVSMLGLRNVFVSIDIEIKL